MIYTSNFKAAIFSTTFATVSTKPERGIDSTPEASPPLRTELRIHLPLTKSAATTHTHTTTHVPTHETQRSAGEMPDFYSVPDEYLRHPLFFINQPRRGAKGRDNEPKKASVDNIYPLRRVSDQWDNRIHPSQKNTFCRLCRIT